MTVFKIIISLSYRLMLIAALCGFQSIDLNAQKTLALFGTDKYKDVCILNYYKWDTLVIIDTLKKDTIISTIKEIRRAKFINNYGLIHANISDGEGLLNSEGKMLNGPYNRNGTKQLSNGYILTGARWNCVGRYDDPLCHGQIIFNAKGDTILYGKGIYEFITEIEETTLLEGFNAQNNRQEKGFLEKTGQWKTNAYFDKVSGSWIVVKE